MPTNLPAAVQRVDLTNPRNVETYATPSVESTAAGRAAGDFVDLRAEMDVDVVVSNCPQINNPCNGFNPTPVRMIVAE